MSTHASHALHFKHMPMQLPAAGDVLHWKGHAAAHVADVSPANSVILCRNKLRSNFGEQPMLMTEHTAVSKDCREKATERMFEAFSVPALFLAKNAVLSSFALGRQTSLVLDVGYEGTVGAPWLADACTRLSLISPEALECCKLCHHEFGQPSVFNHLECLLNLP